MAVPATDAFLDSLSEALADDACAPLAEREATWSALSRRAMALIDAKDARSKERTAALRAMGKLARAGIAIGSQASNDLDAMMERVARWTTAEASFARGGNDFDKRFEATDRHCALLGTYADLISLRPPGEPAQLLLSKWLL